jgi:hypothetical protein
LAVPGPITAEVLGRAKSFGLGADRLTGPRGVAGLSWTAKFDAAMTGVDASPRGTLVSASNSRFGVYPATTLAGAISVAALGEFT